MSKKPHSKKPTWAIDRCLFEEPTTDHTPLDREHIWGDWLKGVVKDLTNKHTLRHTQIGRLGTRSVSSVSHRAGGPLGATAKIVCSKCNSGWMSRVQQSAKPFLVPLIRGRPLTTISMEAQRAIAAWCTMVTMTGEYLVRDSTAVSIAKLERDWLRDNACPPENWRIWIGRARNPIGLWHHYVVPITPAGDVGGAPHEVPPMPNTQTTTFTIGYLLVHMMSSRTDPALVSGWNWPLTTKIGLNLPRIYPSKESLIVWPPQPLDDSDIKLISEALEFVMEGAARSPLACFPIL